MNHRLAIKGEAVHKTRSYEGVSKWDDFHESGRLIEREEAKRRFLRRSFLPKV